jgi:tryptophanyl-tRNA synthetase
MFVQSQVPEVLTLHSLLSMTTPLGWLLRIPSFKEKVRQMGEDEEHVPYGLVGYPVLQTADVILYKADQVPVGVDQVPHIELMREIARRFNRLYGDTFPEPEALLTETPMIYGTDALWDEEHKGWSPKMSKSLDNQVDLAATNEETTKRAKAMATDPQRQRLSDPGRPEVCNVYSLHKIFNPDKLGEIHRQCTNAEIGCVADKQTLADGINAYLAEFRERRRDIAKHPGRVREVLEAGAERARGIARETLAEVYEKMGLA